MLQNPPLRLGEIQQRAFQRNGVAAALSARARTRVFEPATVDDISAYHMHALHIPLDAEQRRSLLWGEFQHGITQRRDPAAGGSTVAHEPRPPVQRALPGRSPRAAPKKKAAALPADWPSRVAQKLHQAMQSSHSRVRDTFDKFDTDHSGVVDCLEFEAALRELKILQALAIPEAEQATVISQVFDAFDADGSGRQAAARRAQLPRRRPAP